MFDDSFAALLHVALRLWIVCCTTVCSSEDKGSGQAVCLLYSEVHVSWSMSLM